MKRLLYPSRRWRRTLSELETNMPALRVVARLRVVVTSTTKMRLPCKRGHDGVQSLGAPSVTGYDADSNGGSDCLGLEL